VQLGVFQSAINEGDPKPSVPCFLHNRYGPVAGQRCFQREAYAPRE
jgi:hypothetical protein